MAWPPPALATTQTNATPQQDRHPAEHAAMALAINDAVAELGANPSGADATVEARLARIEAETMIRGIRWFSTGQNCPVPAATTLVIGTVAWDVPGTPPFAEGNGMRIQGAGTYAIHAGLSFSPSGPAANTVAFITSDSQGMLAMSHFPTPNVETRLAVSAVMSLADQDRVTVGVYLAGPAGALTVAANVCVARIFKM